MKIYFKILVSLFLISCIKNTDAVHLQNTIPTFKVKLDTVNLFDKERNRVVPVAFYSPKTDKKIENQKVVILSHGYSENRLGANKSYSYLTKKLASKGYFVVSIQQELPTDDLIPKMGIPQIVRRPFWERGTENILFVLNEIKKTKPELDYKHLVLIGHSNGGDISVLFAHKYPDLVDKIISLDNRRMELPRTKQPRIYSLRSSDQPADEGVLPTIEEQEKFGIKIIKLPNTIHNDMNDRGNNKQKKEINNYVMAFLNE
ncbi:esterase [Flavobacterium psychrophilum]|uniref:Probable membrane-associated esterase n=1 Tax=Flavobacterium psychrophilum (strain ATCC 49511 / DSM 21280 / CIP 103535 / JIP02/86) TaxID=402612 RepID=A6H234_FLAPJ|nr:alpha/beta fold hydrolase [Flavobacterium psychrophilum]AIG31078.1 esterase [Flavobacterium psychrophilum]AIG33355.1 esterase [Flavobacterium psychrophilum]AIG35505.1 esterase [Flavobacterium psychrophilum]AIG37866.1 esterase [Flavobacterium psychrophilum]AIG40137.1 esterase [Flavobacterium psychrophilum]